MRALSDLWKRLAPGVASRHAEEELDEEIRDHIDRLVRDLVIKGFPQEEAEAEGRRLAYLMGGARAPITLEDRKRILRAWLGEQVTAAEVTIRASISLIKRRTPYFAAITILFALGLGVGGAGIGLGWSVLDWLPHAENSQSVRLLYRDLPNSVGLGDGFTYEAAQAVSLSPEFPEVAAEFFPATDSLLRPGHPTSTHLPAQVSLVSLRYFDLLGVEPFLGTLFSEGIQLGDLPPAVLSFDLWSRWGLGQQQVVGDTLEVGGVKVTVVGVLPPRFRGVAPRGFDLAIPLLQDTRPLLGEGLSWPMRPGANLLRRTAESGEGMDLARTEAFLKDKERPFDRVVEGALFPPMEPRRGGRTRTVLLFTVALAVLVFILAAASAKGFWILVGVREAHRTAVAQAVGATRHHLGTPGMTFILLSLCIGLPLAWVPGRGLMEGSRSALLGSAIPANRLVPSSILLPIMVGIGLALFASTFLTPGRDIRRFALLGGGATGGPTQSRGPERALSWVLALQLVIAGALLVLSGLLYRGWTASVAQDLGYEADQVWVLQFPPGEQRRRGIDGTQLDSLADRVSRLSDIEAVAWSAGVPGQVVILTRVFRRNGTPLVPGEGEVILTDSVQPGFFSVTGLQILHGKPFLPGSDAGGVVVSDALAGLLEPNGDPLTQCLRIGYPEGPCERVVGVVEDVPRAVHGAPARQVFLKAQSNGSRRSALLVRAARGAGPGVGRQLDEVLREAFPWAQAPFTVGNSFLTQFGYQRNGYRFLAMISALPLLLAAAGFFGLFSLRVARSTEEVALRYALGASPGRIMEEVVRGTVLRLIPPVILVAFFLFAGASTLQPLLPGTPILDPAVLSLSILLMFFIALSAVAVPIRNALRVDPALTLKAER